VIRVLIVILCAFALSGCASISKAWKSLVGHDDDPVAKVTTPRFSETDTVKVADGSKQYRRMNRQRFEEEADVKADAGSLWVMEGQGAYLFSQNQMRIVGDLLNVKIEGAPKTQLQTKTKVISGLLARLESAQTRGLASTSPAPAAGAPAAAAPAADANGGANEAAKGANTPDASGFNVAVVPTRIIEQLKDGSYRVRGMQPFMIGKREYKVIVTGVVRPEDFDDAGIEAGKLLDPQFDIVSSRKGLN